MAVQLAPSVPNLREANWRKKTEVLGQIRAIAPLLGRNAHADLSGTNAFFKYFRLRAALPSIFSLPSPLSFILLSIPFQGRPLFKYIIGDSEEVAATQITKGAFLAQEL